MTTDPLDLIERLRSIGKCPIPGPEHSGLVARRYMNTRYVDDDRNWLTSCRACYEAAWSGFDSMWGDSNQPSPFPSQPPADDPLTVPHLVAEAADLIERQQAELTKLTAENAALRDEAQRYRWLRETKAGDWEYLNGLRIDRGTPALDAMIDRAIDAEQRAKGEPS